MAANCYCGNKKADESICLAVDAESITIITATVLIPFLLVMEPMAKVVRQGGVCAGRDSRSGLLFRQIPSFVV